MPIYHYDGQRWQELPANEEDFNLVVTSLLERLDVCGDACDTGRARAPLAASVAPSDDKDQRSILGCLDADRTFEKGLLRHE